MPAGPPSDPPPLEALLEAVRGLLGATRVVVSLGGAGVVAVGPVVVGPEPPTTYLQIVDDEGPAAELLVYGGSGKPDDEVVRAVAAVVAGVADRGHAPDRQRAEVGRIGHDLKTPLTTVLGFSGLIAGGGIAAATPELMDATTRVTEVGERLLTDLEELIGRWRTPPRPR